MERKPVYVRIIRRESAMYEFSNLDDLIAMFRRQLEMRKETLTNPKLSEKGRNFTNGEIATWQIVIGILENGEIKSVARKGLI